MYTLAIESSCDETAAAVLQDCKVQSSIIASQIEIHRKTGGVVPEVASRNHLQQLRPVLEQALKQANITPQELDCIAATSGPGLASSLLVGHTSAKALALALNKPFMAINHLEGHLLSPFLEQQHIPAHLALIVSGGHTMLVDVAAVGEYHLLGRSVDDAAGEAFDKVGKMLDLPYPGGPEIEKLAKQGTPSTFALPKGKVSEDPFSFSFSGLKTAVLYLLRKLDKDKSLWLADLCSSFQHAVCSVLVERTLYAVEKTGRKTIALSGGVACNGYLRNLLQQACKKEGITVHLCPPQWTTDNAAMIGYAAWARLQANIPATDLTEDVNPNQPFTVDNQGHLAPNRATKIPLTKK